jgi:hypothetical protein
MPRKVPVPTVKYEQVENPDLTAIDDVFDLIFELLLKNKGKEKGFTSKE